MSNPVLYIYIYIYIYWPAVIKGDLKVPFSITTTTGCKKGSYFFSWITPLTFDPYLNDEWWARRHQVSSFESLVWLNSGLKTGFTLNIMPIGRLNILCKRVYIICKFVGNFILKRVRDHLHSIKRFHVLISNTNNSI